MSPPVAPVMNDTELPTRVDVAVVGGGIIGVCAAYELAKKGLSVAIFEKGRIAGEQSSRNWGACRQQNRDLRELPLAQQALRMWEGMNEAVGAETGFRRTGLLYCNVARAEFEQMASWTEKARAYGFQSRVLTAVEAQEKSQGCKASFVGGIFSETDGRAEPALAAPAIANAARRLGVSIHQNCAVREIYTEGGRAAGVVTEKGVVRADAVLGAGGAWTSMLFQHHRLAFPQAGIRATSFFTRPVEKNLPSGMVSSRIALRRRTDGGYTVGLVGRGRLDLSPKGVRYMGHFLPTLLKRRKGLSIRASLSVLSGPDSMRRWRSGAESPFEACRILDPAPQTNEIRTALELISELFPDMTGVQIAHQYAGIVDYTPDWVPAISAVDPMPGLYVASGFSGHGFGIGPAAGLLISEIISGAPTCVDPAPFRYARLVDGSSLGQPGMM